MTPADAGGKMEAWLTYYNEERPHGAIGYKVPIEMANPGSRTSQLL
ncbi:integrase core domain-containing protein [Haematobacter genomosp. 1]